MSDSRDVPPVPSRGPPPIPMEVLPLDYVGPLTQGPRPPGLWMAVGIFSLLLGLVSLILNVAVGGMWLDKAWRSVPTAASAVSRVSVLPASKLAPLPSEYVVPGGLDRSARAQAMARFELPTGLRLDDYQAMLDRLLAERGQDILRPGGNGTVTKTGTTSAPQRGLVQAEQRHVYRVPGGVIELGTTGAIFVGNTRSTAVYATSTATFDSQGSGSERRKYAAVTINETLDALRQSDPTLTSAQAATVADLLAGRTFYTSRRGSANLPAVAPVMIGPGNVLTVRVEHIPYLILADGRSCADSPGLKVDPVSGQVMPPAPNFIPALPGSPALMFAQAGHGLAGVMLALVLLVAGLRLVSGKADGAFLHARWAVLKLMMAAIEFALVSMYVESIAPGQKSAVPFDSDRGMAAAGMSVAGQSVYPVIVLLVMFSNASRAYIATQGPPLSLLPGGERRRRATRWLAGSRLAPWVRWSSLILVGVVALHSIAAVPAGLDADFAAVTRHAVVIGVAGVLATRLFRFGSRPAAAIVLLLALACPPAMGQMSSINARVLDPNPEVRLRAGNAVERPYPVGLTDIAMRLLVHPLDGIDPVRQNKATEFKLRCMAAKLLIHHQLATAQRAAKVLVSDDVPTSAERNEILRAIAARRPNLAKLADPDRPLAEWEAVQQVVAADLTWDYQVALAYRHIFEQGDPLTMRLALEALEGTTSRLLPVDASTIVNKLDLSDERTRQAAAKVIFRDRWAVTWPKAAGLLGDALRGGDRAALERFRDMIRSTPRPSPDMVKLAAEPGMPAAVQKEAYDGLLRTDDRQIAYRDPTAYIIQTTLLRENRSDDAGQAMSEILTQVIRGSSPTEAFLHVLRFGTEPAKQRLAAVALDNDSRDHFGPATQAVAMRVLKQPLVNRPATYTSSTPTGGTTTLWPKDIATFAWTVSLAAAVLFVGGGALVLAIASRATRETA